MPRTFLLAIGYAMQLVGCYIIARHFGTPVGVAMSAICTGLSVGLYAVIPDEDPGPAPTQSGSGNAYGTWSR